MPAFDYDDLTPAPVILGPGADDPDLELAPPPAGAAFDHLPDPAWVFDAREKIVGWNRAAGRVYGLPADAALGQPVWLFVPPAATRAFDRALAAARRDGAWAGDLLTQTATGQPRLAAARWALAGPPGDPTAAVVALHADVTEQRDRADAAARAGRWAAARGMLAALADASPEALAHVRAFAHGPDPAAEVTTRGAGNRVLVAGPDPVLREVVRAALDGAGYHPLPAADRFAAVRALAADPDRVRAAVLAFPEHVAVTADLRAVRPLLPVVAVGGDVPLPADPARLLRAVAEAVAADRLAEAGLRGA